jgi:hypothetical protein
VGFLSSISTEIVEIDKDNNNDNVDNDNDVNTRHFIQM